MVESCPHLEYRRSDGQESFDTERGYCNVAEQFVQPMRADICNDRYEMHHATHCEIYQEHEKTADSHDGTAGGDP